MRQFPFVIILSFISLFLIIDRFSEKDGKITENTTAKRPVTVSPVINENDDEEEDEYTSDIIYPHEKKYYYRITISNAQREWETYETQEMTNGEVRLKRTSPDVSYLNGTYEWESDIYLPDEDAMFNYICDNYSVMKNYKVSNY